MAHFIQFPVRSLPFTEDEERKFWQPELSWLTSFDGSARIGSVHNNTTSAFRGPLRSGRLLRYPLDVWRLGGTQPFKPSHSESRHRNI